MQRSDFLHRMTFWKRMIWLIIIGTVLLLLAIAWIFHQKVSRIDREFEKVPFYEAK